MSVSQLSLVAVGAVTPVQLRDLEEPLRAQLGVQVSAGRSALPDLQYAYNKDRQQYHAAAIMRRLQLPAPAAPRGPAPLVLGVCDVDLFEPDSDFIFGQSDRESRIALVSTHRLAGAGDVGRRRLTTEVVHHAGHLVGLSYCEDARCAMFLSIQVSDVDRKHAALCHNCKNELAKLQR